jgi:AraC-like DNA-binding protein
MSQALASTTALAGVPEFIEATSGKAAIAKVFQAVDVPASVIGQRGFFITHRAFCGILEQGARIAGDPDFGLSMAPRLDIRTWGPFGAYVTAGQTFTGALQRLMLALPHHGDQDRMEMVATGDEIQFHYDIPSSGTTGYRHYAVAAVRYIHTIVAPYLPPGWVPVRIAFDFPKPRKPSVYEDLFQCPVIFDAPRWTLVIRRETELVEKPVIAARPGVTLSDLRRLAKPVAPTDFPAKVNELIRLQLLDGMVDIDRMAAQLGIGVRTLQRRLGDHNLVFRDLVLRTRLERAIELLRETDEPITQIATALGYASPANFSRSFRHMCGVSPRELRKTGLVAAP